MTAYKRKFTIYYVVFMIAMGIVFSVVARLATAVVLQAAFEDFSDMTVYMVNCIIETICTLLVMYLGISPAINHATKGEDAPEYENMKKFAIILFAFLAIVQAIYSAVNIIEYKNEVDELVRAYPFFEEEVNAYGTKVMSTYIISTIALVVGQLLMIPVTLKKYE